MQAEKNPTRDEQVLAAIAHASAISAFFGPLIPALIWMILHRKSSFVAFHTLQAIGYQTLSLWVGATVLPVLLIAGPLLVIVPTASAGSGDQTDAVVPLLMFGVWGLILAALSVYLGIALAGAIGCLTGRAFYYPFFGRRMARYLDFLPGSGQALSEDRTDSFLAATGHATAIVSPWGIFFPALLWLTQQMEGSRRLRFQSLQAALFQGLGALCYLAGSAIYTISFIGSLALVYITSRADSPEAGIPALAFLLLTHLCFISLFVLFVPLYYALASWASYRILRGHDYRYPFLGSILAQRLSAGAAEGEPDRPG